MIAWLAMGLHGCAWIGAEQHQDALVDAWGLTVLEVFRVDACEGTVAQVFTSTPLPAGTKIRWSFAEVEVADVELTPDPNDPRFAWFTIGSGALIGTCASMVEGCVGDLTVELDTPQTPLKASGRLQIAPTPTLPTLRLSSNAPLTGDVVIDANPTLVVSDANGYALAVRACPVGGSDADCRTEPFDEDLTLPTSLFDACPAIGEPFPEVLPDWTLTLVGVRDACDDSEYLGPTIPARFLDDDCDQDGMSALEEDCDDLDPLEPLLRFRDLDGDGVGSGAAELTCVAGTPWVTIDGDCDDDDDDVYPGAVDDTCNGVDEDCSCPSGTEPDEGCDGNAGTGANVFADADEDGWGAGGPVGIGFCPVEGLSFQTGDCAPGDGSVHPGATEDYGDLTDQDCDGCAHLDGFADDTPGVPQLLILTSDTVSRLEDGLVEDLLTVSASRLTAGHFTLGDGRPDLAFVEGNNLKVAPRPGVTPTITITSIPDPVRALAPARLNEGPQAVIALTSDAILTFPDGVVTGQSPTSLGLAGYTRMIVRPDLEGASAPDPALFVFGGPAAGNEQVLTWDGAWDASPLDALNAGDAVFTPEGELIVVGGSGTAIAADLAGPFVEIADGGSRLALDVDPDGDHGVAVAFGGGVRITRRTAGVWAPAVDILLDGTPIGLAWGDFDGDGTRDLGVGTSSFAAGPAGNRVLFDVFEDAGSRVVRPLGDPLIAHHAVAIDLDQNGRDELVLMSADATDPNGLANTAYVYPFTSTGPPVGQTNHAERHSLIPPIPLGVPGGLTSRPECLP